MSNKHSLQLNVAGRDSLMMNMSDARPENSGLPDASMEGHLFNSALIDEKV